MLQTGVPGGPIRVGREHGPATRGTCGRRTSPTSVMPPASGFVGRALGMSLVDGVAQVVVGVGPLAEGVAEIGRLLLDDAHGAGLRALLEGGGRTPLDGGFDETGTDEGGDGVCH